MTSIKIIGELHAKTIRPKYPKVVTGPEISPQGLPAVPTTPVITKAQLNKDKIIDIEWSPSTANNKLEHILVAILPVYSSEVGWFRALRHYFYGSEVTKANHELQDVPTEERVNRTQVYSVRAQSNGFFSDLHNEKEIHVHPDQLPQ